MARRKRPKRQRPGKDVQTAVENSTAVEEAALGSPKDEGPTGAEDGPLDEEPIHEEPTHEEPTAEAPAEDEPANAVPAEEEPAEAVPVEEQLTDEEPTAEAPAEDEPANAVPAEEQLTDEEPTTEAPVVEEPTPEPASDVEASPAAYEVPEAAAPALASDQPTKPAGHVEGAAAWRRIFRMGRPRATKGNLLGVLLAVALGIGIATQVQLTNERGLSQLSQPELIRLLDDISARSNRLDQQVRELEITRDRLLGGTASTGEALEQAQRRADTLGILAGTLGARGPGITVSISDPDRAVSGPVILDLIQELRDAGAESIEVGGVRVVASSYVGDSGGELSIDGTQLPRPIIVKAIGDSNTLASAMTIPGGIVETIRQEGANATVNESTSIAITSLHQPTDPVHAVPSQ